MALNFVEQFPCCIEVLVWHGTAWEHFTENSSYNCRLRREQNSWIKRDNCPNWWYSNKGNGELFKQRDWNKRTILPVPGHHPVPVGILFYLLACCRSTRVRVLFYSLRSNILSVPGQHSIRCHMTHCILSHASNTCYIDSNSHMCHVRFIRTIATLYNSTNSSSL